MEFLRGNITLPPSAFPQSLLAKHEESKIAELQAILATAKHHRDPELEVQLLPECQPLIEAIGHRMAYDAAVKRGVDQGLIDLYVASVLQSDPAWYVERAGISRAEQKRMQTSAVAALLPHTETLLEALDVSSYTTAPIVSDERWNNYVNTLETFGNVPRFTSAGTIGIEPERFRSITAHL